MTRVRLLPAMLLLAALPIACAPKQPAATPAATPTPTPSPFPGTTAATPTPTPPGPPPIPPTAPVVPRAGEITTDPLESASLDDINRSQKLQPAFFTYDSDQLDELARKVLEANAQVLGKYTRWVITIEGHCDERGSAEYNLALGDRRALAAKNYLVTLGIAQDRIKTVSYGKEFPFDLGHDDAAWIKNRRAQFVVTAK